MENENKPTRGRPTGTKKEPSKIYARGIKQSKYADLEVKLDAVIKESN